MLKTSVQKAALVFGIVFILIGVLGFIPFALTSSSIFGDDLMGMHSGMSHEYLLGIFAISSVHNVIHILSGVVALGVSLSHKASRVYFGLFFVVYLLVTLIGFATGSFLGLMDVNQADNFLHVLISLGAMYFAFFAAGPRGYDQTIENGIRRQ